MGENMLQWFIFFFQAEDGIRYVERSRGLGNLSRTDLILDEAGSPWFIDVNVIPGMTETSLLPIAAKAEGDLEDLYDALVRNPFVRP